jgi:hypothetical protein
VTDRKEMAGSHSTGQSPQWAVVPVEEEEVVRVHAVQTYTGSRGISPRILSLGGFTTGKNPSTR